MNNVLISIIVPVYGVENYLRRCLDSLVNQTLKDIEIIVVNDGSPDGSQDIIEEYEKKYPLLVKGYRKENGGLSDARNYGMQFAIGEYIGFVDSDDYVDHTMYEKMYNEAIESQAEIVTCGYYGLDETKEKTVALQMGNMVHFRKSLFENPKLLYINSPYAWNKIYKKSLFDRTGIRYPKGLLFEDISTTYPLFLSANKISKVNEPLYFYILKRAGSITATYSPKLIQVIDSLAILNNYYKNNKYFISFEKELLFINLKHIYNRLFEYKEYKNKEFQYRFLEKSFQHLNKYFPQWREDTFFFNWIIGNNGIKKYLFKKELFWKFVISIPNEIINCISQKFKIITSGLTKPKKLIKKIFKKEEHNRFVYIWNHKYGKVRKNEVLFESFHGTNLSDSPYYLMKELVKDNKFKIYFTTNNYEKHKKYIKENNLPIKLVKLKSFKYQKLLATCEFLVNNVSFPDYYIRKEHQHYLNTWHGTPLKTLGKCMKKGIESMHNIQHNFLQSDLLLFPNEFTKKVTMRDYNLENLYTGRTVVNGYPRNSIFKDELKNRELRKKLNIENKTVYAYMPTWRGENSININNISYVKELKSLLNRIDSKLKDNQVMYVNLHPLLQKNVNINNYRHIYEFHKNIDNYEFLNCVDALITDYSSVFFDYSVTEKPIIMFMYDYENYMENRGVYFDIKTLPFKQIFDIDEFIDVLVNEKFINFKYNDKAYEEKYIKYDSINASRDLIEMFFYGKNTIDRVENYEFNRYKEKNICYAPIIRTRDQLVKLCEKYDVEKTIFIFEMKNFNSTLNTLLFEEFNNKIDYIVIKKIHLVTYFEKVYFHFNKQLLRENMSKQELQRCLPSIIINKINVEKV